MPRQDSFGNTNRKTPKNLIRSPAWKRFRRRREVELISVGTTGKNLVTPLIGYKSSDLEGNLG